MRLFLRYKLTTLLFIVTGIFFAVLLVSKLQLGMIRYFDADEMAYLHWAHNLTVGHHPYRDFLLYVPSGFLFVLAPLFWLFHGVPLLIASRVFAWTIYVALTFILGLIFLELRGDEAKTKRAWMFILPGLFLSLLAIPADKMLEVRPDNIAVLFSIIGTLLQVHWLRTEHKKYLLFSAHFYGLSLLFLPKTLPQVVVGLAVFGGWSIMSSATTKEKRANFLVLLKGLCIPFILFGVWILATSGSWIAIGQAIYSLILLPFEVNKIGALYPIMPYQFFYPNLTFYGVAGVTAGLLMNHSLWVVGVLVGTVRLVTPFLAHGKKGVWAELLLAGTFMVYLAAYVLWYPMRHAQYLIPVAVFVAFYLADLVVLLFDAASHSRFGGTIFVAIFCLALYSAYAINATVIAPKFSWTNLEDKEILTDALKTIPKDAYVLDLVGSTIYFRDPYYVSAISFADWQRYLSRPLPSLASALEQTHTQFIYQDKLGRINDVPPETKSYIDANYTQSQTSEFLELK